MANVFKLRPKAERDLESIYLYSVGEWGSDRAEQYIYDLEKAFQNLAENHTLGRDRAYIRPNLRAFPVESHVIFYKPTDCGVAIIRVLHKSMDEERHL